MAGQMLGIMVTRHANLEHITGAATAARNAGHPVTIFLTDDGVKFTRDPKFLELLKVGGIEIAVCEHSCERIGLPDKAEGISYGSQYNNAGMLHDSARVLVF